MLSQKNTYLCRSVVTLAFSDLSVTKEKQFNKNTMKRFFMNIKSHVTVMVTAAAVALSSTSCYDDGAIWEEIDGIKQELADLRATIESELNAIKELVNGQVTVTDVKQQADGSKQITLSDGTKISVYPKADEVPANLVTVYTEGGVLYWAMYDGLGNAQPIMVNGKMVPVSDVAPKTQVVDGAIEVSFDGGATWVKTGYEQSAADSIIKDIDVTYSDWQTDSEGNPLPLYCTITFADGSTLKLGMQNGKLVLPFDSMFVPYGSEMPFTIEVQDVADFMTTTPKGWECDVEFDAKNDRMTLNFAAPEYEDIVSGEAKQSGVAKLMVVFNNGSSAIASIKLSTNPANTYFTNDGVYLEVGYGTNYILCGIIPTESYNAETLLKSCQTVLGGGTSQYVYQVSFMESLIEFIPYKEMRTKALEADVQYTFWYIAPRTNEDGDLYVDANELTTVLYTHSSVKFAVTETSFFDVNVTFDVKGSQPYMLGLVESSEFNAAELAAYYTENYDYLSATREDVNFSGSILELMERTSQKLNYGTEYTLYYIAKNDSRVILEDNVYSWSFSTQDFTPGGAIEIVADEPTIDYKSINMSLNSNGQHIAIIYNAMPSYMATAYPDDSYIIDMLLSEGVETFTSSSVSAKYQGQEPGEKVTFFAVAVDAEGKIGKPFKQEYTTKSFEYNDLEVALTLVDYKVDNTLIAVSCDGAVSYRYIYCALDDNNWKEVYGGTAKKAGEYIIQNPTASNVYDTATADDALVDGNIFIKGLNTETEYVLVCVAIDANGVASHPATCYFEPIANIGNMVKRTDPNWAEGKPEIIMGETFDGEFFNISWYTKPQKGYVAYSMVDHPENLVSDYFSTNINTPEKLIAYIVAGCDNGRRDCGHKCEYSEDGYSRTWTEMEDLNGDGRIEFDELVEYSEDGLPGVYNSFFYGTKDEHLIYVTWVGEDGNFHEPFAWDPTNDVEVELKW